MNEVLTAGEVRKVLGISNGTFYALVRSDPDFATFKVRGSRRMTRKALETWVKKQEQKEAAA